MEYNIYDMYYLQPGSVVIYSESQERNGKNKGFNSASEQNKIKLFPFLNETFKMSS